jgi:hypothetical protein
MVWFFSLSALPAGFTLSKAYTTFASFAGDMRRAPLPFAASLLIVQLLRLHPSLGHLEGLE